MVLDIKYFMIKNLKKNEFNNILENLKKIKEIKVKEIKLNKIQKPHQQV